MSENDVQEIGIAGVDQEKTLANSVNGTIYRVHLSLTAPAPADWRRIFESEWRFPRTSMWRRAHATERHIIIECPIDEIERYHKAPLKEVLGDVNRKYREHLAEAQTREARRRAEQDAATQRAKADLSKIKF
ncbi:hypothetical protein [Myxococcus sp. Y35]|uniref:hypothetical protein n=1 Tax=Pseudomyxococcus flavus TaxID=3115648 RepID=UPI003CF01069